MKDTDMIFGIVVAAKYRTMCRLIEIVDYRTRKNLPVMVQEFAPRINSSAARSERMTFLQSTPLINKSLETALRDAHEPLYITSESMIMYFTENEVDPVVANIRKKIAPST